MKVGTVPSVLHQCYRHEPPYIHAFSESPAFYSLLPLPHSHFSPSASDNVRQMHSELKVARTTQKQNGLEYVKLASKWRGHTGDHHSWRITERQKWRLSCQKLNAMKISEHHPSLPTVSLNKGISLVLMFVSTAKLYTVKEISPDLIRFKISRERLAPSCTIEDNCFVFYKTVHC